MLFVKRISSLAIIILSLSFISACSDDLNPSSSDKRSNTGAISEDFSVTDNEGNLITLSEELTTNDAVLLYFTMWCTVCDSHMSSLRENVKPKYENVRYLLVDYVSANIPQSAGTQSAFGYRSETVIADTTHTLLAQYDGGMGKTIIIHKDMSILLNEDYKESRVAQILDSINNTSP